jgi:hypothetical protein
MKQKKPKKHKKQKKPKKHKKQAKEAKEAQEAKKAKEASACFFRILRRLFGFLFSCATAVDPLAISSVLRYSNNK